MVSKVVAGSSLNPTITFGKHVGTLLSDLPRSYLGWLASQNPPIMMYSQNWTKLAGDFLKGNVDPLGSVVDLDPDCKLPVENLTVDPGQFTTDILGEITEPPPEIRVSATALNSFSTDQTLLMTFITRINKSIGIASHVQNLTVEAWENGDSTGGLKLQAGMEQKTYAGYAFAFRKTWKQNRLTLVLADVKPCLASQAIGNTSSQS